jgi:hypothetical protein
MENVKSHKLIENPFLEEYQYRKVQGVMGESSFSFVIPKVYATHIGIGKGDFVKVILEEDQLVVRKA